MTAPKRSSSPMAIPPAASTATASGLAPDYDRFCGGVKALCKIDLFQYRPAQMERRMRSFAHRSGHDDLDAYLAVLRRDFFPPRLLLTFC